MRRAAFRRLAELLALTGFAIAQPVLDVTGRSPDFFLFHHPTPGQVRALVLLLAFGPPLLLWLAELAVGAVSETAARTVHLAFVAALGWVLAVHVGRHVQLATGPALAVGAAVVAVAVAVVAARSERLRLALRYASPAPLVFLLLFALVSPAGPLVRPFTATNVAAARADKPAPVVFLLFDAFPERTLLTDDGTIDERLYPNFARLAALSTWYPNATGVSGWTPYAVPAMLSGRYPERVAAPSYVEYPRNLFTLLGGQYDIRAQETITGLCPPRLCPRRASAHTGLAALVRDTLQVAKDVAAPTPSRRDPTEQYAEPPPPGLDDVGTRAKAYLQVDSVRAQLDTFVAGLAPRPRPTLHFAHFLLPHGPWRRLPSGQAFKQQPADFLPSVDGKLLDRRVPAPATLADVSHQRLLAQVGYVDAMLGRVLDRMRDTGLLDTALLVVTADHGDGLVAKAPQRALDDRNAADLAWVPLFVRLPGQRAGVVDRRDEQHVDLLPTIADVLGVQVPWAVDGVSLLRAAPVRDKRWYDVPGHPIVFDERQFAATVRTGWGAYVTPDLGTSGVFAPEPLRALWGRRVADLDVGVPDPRAVFVDDATAATHTDPAAARVHALLWGDVIGTGPRDEWLAVAVNGRIAGGVAVFPKRALTRFVGLVDPAAWLPGSNTFAFYAIDGTTLHPLAVHLD